MNKLMQKMEYALDDRELSAVTKLVYLTMLYFREKGIEPRLRDIEDATNLSRESILQHIRILEELGYIQKQKIGRRNYYLL